MMFVTVAGGIRRVLLIQLNVSEDSGSVISQHLVASEGEVVTAHHPLDLVSEQLIGAQDRREDRHA
jgi:hypothetical protein